MYHRRTVPVVVYHRITVHVPQKERYVYHKKNGTCTTKRTVYHRITVPVVVYHRITVRVPQNNGTCTTKRTARVPSDVLASVQLGRPTEIWRPKNVRPKSRHISTGFGGMPPRKYLKFGSRKWHFLHFEDTFEQNLKVSNHIWQSIF